uniref:Uncharacterized protein n=1 Tax=Setaria italica TaxID=4555 RepID=K4AHY6_SETIT
MACRACFKYRGSKKKCRWQQKLKHQLINCEKQVQHLQCPLTFSYTAARLFNGG